LLIRFIVSILSVAIFFFILFSAPAEENESVIVVECQRLDGGTSVFIIPKRKKEKEGGRERERERERERVRKKVRNRTDRKTAKPKAGFDFSRDIFDKTLQSIS